MTHKPVIFISKCLTAAKCRWDGEILTDELARGLKTEVTLKTICPECEIGLGVPRDPIRLVLQKCDLRLIQPATGKDLTGKMKTFARNFLSSIKAVDGFILKDRSPSCGIKNVKVYRGPTQKIPIKRSSGFLGKCILEYFPGIPVETDGRLADPALREQFLKRVFAHARQRS